MALIRIVYFMLSLSAAISTTENCKGDGAETCRVKDRVKDGINLMQNVDGVTSKRKAPKITPSGSPGGTFTLGSSNVVDASSSIASGSSPTPSSVDPGGSPGGTLTLDSSNVVDSSSSIAGGSSPAPSTSKTSKKKVVEIPRVYSDALLTGSDAPAGVTCQVSGGKFRSEDANSWPGRDLNGLNLHEKEGHKTEGSVDACCTPPATYTSSTACAIFACTTCNASTFDFCNSSYTARNRYAHNYTTWMNSCYKAAVCNFMRVNSDHGICEPYAECNAYDGYGPYAPVVALPQAAEAQEGLQKRKYAEATTEQKSVAFNQVMDPKNKC